MWITTAFFFLKREVGGDGREWVDMDKEEKKEEKNKKW